MEYSRAGHEQLRHSDQNLISFLAEEARRFSPEALAAVGLASGALAFAAALVGIRSWMLPGSALALWLFSGCGLFFRTEPTSRAVSVAAFLLVVSGVLVAVGVLVGLYLVALGPSWVP